MEASLNTFLLNTAPHTPAQSQNPAYTTPTPKNPAGVSIFQCPAQACNFRTTSTDPERAVKRHILAISKDHNHTQHAAHVELHKKMEEERRPTPAKTKASQDRYRAANRQKRSDAARYCQLKKKIRQEGVITDEREIEEKAKELLRQAQERRANRERELRIKFGLDENGDPINPPPANQEGILQLNGHMDPTQAAQNGQQQAQRTGTEDMDAVGDMDEMGLQLQMDMDLDSRLNSAHPEPSAAPAGRKVKLWEVCDLIRTAYDRMEEATKGMDPETAEATMRRWVEGLEMVNKGFLKANGPPVYRTPGRAPGS